MAVKDVAACARMQECTNAVGGGVDHCVELNTCRSLSQTVVAASLPEQESECRFDRNMLATGWVYVALRDRPTAALGCLAIRAKQ